MSEVLFKNIPSWLPTLIMAIPWTIFTFDLIKTKDFLKSFRKNYEFIIWGVKAAVLLVVGRTTPLPEEPWILVLIFWGLLDMRLNLFSRINDRETKQRRMKGGIMYEEEV